MNILISKEDTDNTEEYYHIDWQAVYDVAVHTDFEKDIAEVWMKVLWKK